MAASIHPSQYIAIACTTVGCGPGGNTHMLARVVLVDFRGQSLYDKYVAPTMPVDDYRTERTGLLAAHLANATPFPDVQQEVGAILRSGKILVGHALWEDLSVLGIPHAAVATRDVALYAPFRTALAADNILGLQTLVGHLMGRRVQEQQLNPVRTRPLLTDRTPADPPAARECARGDGPVPQRRCGVGGADRMRHLAVCAAAQHLLPLLPLVAVQRVSCINIGFGCMIAVNNARITIVVDNVPRCCVCTRRRN